MFIIKDWAGNVLNYKGRFDLKCFAVPMTFESFDDGWQYIVENFDETEFNDLFVESEEQND